MSDDIVTRLRDKAKVEAPLSESIIFRVAFPIMDEAANEIERLREQNEHLRANVEMLLADAREAHRG